jgi:hypothetical protein
MAIEDRSNCVAGAGSGCYIVQPPDTSITAPLMYDASSEASHA